MDKETKTEETKEKPEKQEKPPVIVRRSVKHTFTRDERDQLQTDLLNALSTKDSEEEQFESIKATYKAKVTEAESRVCTVVASLRAGFDVRTKECQVVFEPEKKKKHFYVLETGEHVATEDMTPDDYQQELIQAESVFDSREEINLFPPAGQDRGVLVVGRMKDRWFSALRIKVGNSEINERLDSEQRAFKQRFDAITTAHKRAKDWAKIQLKEAAKGFEEPMTKAVEAQKERVE